MTVYSFAPIATPRARVLILGSMPGERSLAQQEYYAHPHNSFWPIMGAIFDAPVTTYAQKTALIRNHDIALWDVLKACTRAGSLDQAIDRTSIVANDFAQFLAQHAHIAHILFNGSAAHDIFMRHVSKKLPPELQARLTLHKLPSTSPAMASLNRAKKTHVWRAALAQARTSAS